MLKDINPYVKLGVFAVGGYLIYRFGSKALAVLEVSDTDKEQAKARAKGMKETYSAYEYNQFANTLTEAQGTFDDDEELVYGIFRKLKNDADYLALDEAFGEYDAGWFSGSKSMVQFLRSFLNNEEVRKVNNILAERNIKYQI